MLSSDILIMFKNLLGVGVRKKLAEKERTVEPMGSYFYLQEWFYTLILFPQVASHAPRYQGETRHFFAARERMGAKGQFKETEMDSLPTLELVQLSPSEPTSPYTGCLSHISQVF